MNWNIPIAKLVLLNFLSIKVAIYVFFLGAIAEDLDKLREMGMFGENGRDGVWTVIANVMDPESLHEAFDGCVGVFHTSSLVDPGGISGYTVSYSTCIGFILYLLSI
jgi:hypothetical protein